MKNKSVSKKSFVTIVAIIGFSIMAIVSLMAILSPKSTVKTEAAEIKSVASTIQAEGTITPQTQAVLHFQTAGKLTYLPFKEGDSIVQGQTIASLDSTILQKQLSQALNTYRSTRDSFDQTKENQDKSIIQNQQKTITQQSDTSYLNDVAKRIVDQNQANLDNSVLNVEITQQAIYLSTIASPISGIVTHLDVTTPGLNITPSTSFIVADPSSLVFRANISENNIDFISEGSTATIKLGNGNNTIFGTVLKIYPDKVTLPSGQKSYQVDIESNDMGQYGKMGQSGTVLIQSNLQNVTKLVPTWTVLNHDSIWVLSGGVPVLRTITTGKIHGEMTEVLSGLHENDRVIINPESIAARHYQLL